MRLGIVFISVATIVTACKARIDDSPTKDVSIATPEGGVLNFFMSASGSHVCLNYCEATQQADTAISTCTLRGAAPLDKLKSATLAPEERENWQAFISMIEDRENKHPLNYDKNDPLLKKASALLNPDEASTCIDNKPPRSPQMNLTGTNQNCILYAKSSSFAVDTNAFIFKHLWIATAYVAENGSLSETPPLYYKIKTDSPVKLVWTQYQTLPSGRQVEVGQFTLQGTSVWDWHTTSKTNNQHIANIDGNAVLPKKAVKLECPNDVVLELKPKNATTYSVMN